MEPPLESAPRQRWMASLSPMGLLKNTEIFREGRVRGSREKSLNVICNRRRSFRIQKNSSPKGTSIGIASFTTWMLDPERRDMICLPGNQVPGALSGRVSSKHKRERSTLREKDFPTTLSQPRQPEARNLPFRMSAVLTVNG